jgi:hypothetical protein|tara:strand:- start:330 stop:491 length:162 start_codon:yes stop_codon:yes gene_type:complete
MDLDVNSIVTHKEYGRGKIKLKFSNGDVIFKIVFDDIAHPLFLIHSEVEEANE